MTTVSKSSIDDKRDLTKTSLFILPLILEQNYTNKILFGNEIVKQNLKKTNFINAFRWSIERPYLEDNVFVVLDYEKPYWETTSKILNSQKYLKKTHFVSFKQKKYDLYIFDIPQIYKNDIEKVIEGEYSKLTTEAKNKITGFWYHNEEIKAILKKDITNLPIGMLRRQENGEFLEKPNIIEETMPEEECYKPKEIKIPIAK